MAAHCPTSYENDIEVISEHETMPNQKISSAIDDERSSSSMKSTSPEQNLASQPLTGGEAIVRTYTKSPDYLPLAIIVCIINPPFGIVAVVFSVLSRNHSIQGEFAKGHTNSRISMWVSLVGVACSVVLGVFIVVYFLVIEPNIIRSIEELQT